MTSGAAPGRLVPVLIAGVLAISLSAILIRWAGEAPGLAVAVWRTIFATLLLAPFAAVKSRHELAALTRKDVGLIILAGVLLGLHFVSWIESLYHTSVASASTLVTMSPIFIAVFGVLLLKEHVPLPVALAIAGAIAGTIIVGLVDHADTSLAVSNPRLGNGLALTAAALYAFYLLIGRVVRQKTSWLTYVFPLYVAAAGTALAVAMATGVPLFGYDPKIYLLCAAMAVIPQIIGHGAFNYAVKYMPAAKLGVIGLLEPIGASMLAWALFGEIPSWIGIAGMALILGSVAVAVVKPKRKLPDAPFDA